MFYTQSVFSSPRFIPSPYFIPSPQSVVRSPCFILSGCLRCPPWVDLHNFQCSKIDTFGQPNPFHQRRMNRFNLAVQKKNMESEKNLISTKSVTSDYRPCLVILRYRCEKDYNGLKENDNAVDQERGLRLSTICSTRLRR